MTQTYQDLAQRAISVYEKSKQRVIISLAGIPGSGKSTIATQLSAMINKLGVESVVVGIDGFHYSREYLNNMPDPKLAFKRRGAEFSFDAKTAVEFINNLRSSNGTIFGPSFDHKIKDPVPNGTRIPVTAKIIFIEGLYLLLDKEPWNEIKQMATESWWINPDIEVCMQRVANRHIASGIVSTVEDAILRVDTNDILNARFIMAHCLTPDLVIEL